MAKPTGPRQISPGRRNPGDDLSRARHRHGHFVPRRERQGPAGLPRTLCPGDGMRSNPLVRNSDAETEPK
jgi:hypothetical protein